MAEGVSIEQLLANLRLSEGGEGASTPRAKVLDELTLDGVVKRIQDIATSEDKCKIIVMTGAGISTAAGIPDFRSPGSGLYDNLQKYHLPNPQAIFEIGYFRCNPQPFFHLAKELYPGNFKPTLSHYFIRLLAEKGLLLKNFTQNIDTLERRAGVDADLLVEAHGAFHNAHCIDCGKEYTHTFVKGDYRKFLPADLVFQDKLPLCTQPDCAKEPQEEDEPYHGLVKPDIVFFGEALPDRFARCAVQDTKKCELLLVMGTSLVVHPFASLVDRVPDDCPRLLINLEKVGQSNPLMRLLGMGGGLDFSTESGYRDVFLEGTCDDGCRQLARKLGWEDELMKLYTEEHARLDREMAEAKGQAKEADGEGGVEEKGTAPRDDREMAKAKGQAKEADGEGKGGVEEKGTAPRDDREMAKAKAKGQAKEADGESKGGVEEKGTAPRVAGDKDRQSSAL